MQSLLPIHFHSDRDKLWPDEPPDSYAELTTYPLSLRPG